MVASRNAGAVIPDGALAAIADNPPVYQQVQCQIMRPPITLTFHHLDHSGALEDRARKLGSRLGLFGERILRCHMTLEGPGNRKDGARAPYLVKIDLTVPTAQIHADSLGFDGAGHEDIFVALREAFNNARRQLKDLQRRRWRPLRA